MRVKASKTKSLVLSHFPALCSLQINEEAVEQVEKLKHLRTVFTSDGKLEEIGRQIRVASGVVRGLARCTVTKADLTLKNKHSVLKSILIPMLTYDQESWTMTEKLRTRVRAAEMEDKSLALRVSRGP
ncbi:unnamed protein product [Soboliphyme baturini]|uniref:Tick transposon n=1 Tax=Soboliphyme baturini TaxID=241478 RepID=A0A183J0V5_9BILA|nr:unnamed protein product [Soboliphyme baturini]